MAEKDYSATPLSKKLGAKPGVEVLVLFTTSLKELKRRFPALKKTLAPADGLWVAWPKKASKVETDLDFQTVQEIGLAAGLVEVNKLEADLDAARRTSSGGFELVGRLWNTTWSWHDKRDWLERVVRSVVVTRGREPLSERVEVDLKVDARVQM